MDTLLLLRCQNLQKGIAELGGADVFLTKYGSFFGEDQTLSSNYLYKLLSGKIPIREHMARAAEQVLHKPEGWLDQASAGSVSKAFDTWPRAADSAAYARLTPAQKKQLGQHADALVEQWGVVDWRHVRVLPPGK